MKDRLYHFVLENLKHKLFDFLISNDFSQFRHLPEPLRSKETYLYICKNLQDEFREWLVETFGQEDKTTLFLLVDEIIANEFFHHFDMDQMMKEF